MAIRNSRHSARRLLEHTLLSVKSAEVLVDFFTVLASLPSIDWQRCDENNQSLAERTLSVVISLAGQGNAANLDRQAQEGLFELLVRDKQELGINSPVFDAALKGGASWFLRAIHRAKPFSTEELSYLSEWNPTFSKDVLAGILRSWRLDPSLLSVAKSWSKTIEASGWLRPKMSIAEIRA